ncbi:MAG: putative peptidoglycan-binding domain-containing protein [Rhodobacteraceae bacterium HLUCCA12]|nr:MAG: putative peptidoglycan-binding domain-containing protein [Rhodobacteraceae bacterium HLUCCA12]
MTRPYAALILLAALALGACQSGQPGAQDMAQRADTRPATLANAGGDGCWATDDIPAPSETIMEEVIITPARTDAQGQVVEPAEVAWRERTVETGETEERLFAVPCPEQMDADFIKALQRALAVRGLFDGSVNGEMDSATQDAVRAFQRPQGLNSAILSLDAAQQLGLVAMGRAAF